MLGSVLESLILGNYSIAMFQEFGCRICSLFWGERCRVQDSGFWALVPGTDPDLLKDPKKWNLWILQGLQGVWV